MGERPSHIPKWFADSFRQQLIENHEARKKRWPWYGRLQHLVFVSWRCAACKAAAARQLEEGVEEQ